jgi:replication factor C subunit 3/5
MEGVLHYVAKRAPFTLPPEVAKKIVDDSGGNLRKAILVLEALKMQSYVQLVSMIIPVPIVSP